MRLVWGLNEITHRWRLPQRLVSGLAVHITHYSHRDCYRWRWRYYCFQRIRTFSKSDLNVNPSLASSSETFNKSYLTFLTFGSLFYKMEVMAPTRDSVSVTSMTYCTEKCLAHYPRSHLFRKATVSMAQGPSTHTCTLMGSRSLPTPNTTECSLSQNCLSWGLYFRISLKSY